MVLRAKWIPQNLLFFVLSFVYVWLVVEPHLIYYCLGTILPDAPQYATGWPFLKDSLSTPSGLVAYGSGLLSQGYYYPWLGAVIIVLVGFSLAELARRHLGAAGTAGASVLGSLPAIVFFLICSHYKHPLPASLTVSLGLLLSLVFARLPSRRPPVPIAAFCLAAALGFWFGGAGATSVFAVTTVLREVLVRRDWTIVAIATPASIAIVWALAEYLFLIPAREAFRILTPAAAPVTAGMDAFLKALTLLLYGAVPLMILLVFFVSHVFGKHDGKAGAGSRKKKSHGKDRHAARRQRPSLAFLRKPVLAAFPVTLMAAGLSLTHDELRKPYVLSNCYWHQERWDKIIELAHDLPSNKGNAFVSHDFMRALYHTGRLPYDMFRRPLIPEAILLTHEKKESNLTQLKLSGIFVELGYVNMAQKLASELLATKVHSGAVLETLGWIHIIKKHPLTARVYLEALRKDPIYRRRAESLLRGLDRGFTGDQAARIDRIRSYMQDEAVVTTGAEPVDETLAALLKQNPRNKMAFEYLMACYLLTGQVDKIAENMARLRDLGYESIPTLYQEAVLIHYGSQRQGVAPASLNISLETLKRYERFVQIRAAMESPNRQEAFNRLIREFGSSYFFYYSFGQVGL